MTAKAGSPELRVLEALEASTRGPLKAKEIARALSVPTAEYRRLRRTLTGLERAGKIYRVKGHRYAVAGSLDLVVGSVSVTRSGDGFVRPDESTGDVFVPGGQLATAMDGDRVVVRIESRPRGRSAQGRIIKILERARDSVVGTFHRSRSLRFVVPLDPRISRDVLVPEGADGGAEAGDVVVVRLSSYGEGRVGPVGEVEHVLGALSDPGVDVLALAHGFGLPLDFPPEVESAARAAADLEPAAGRIDRTELLTFTVDPADAKDHDDALSITRGESGETEVGVHIADVSHFVPEGGPVDREAFARGTSVYLVDRTLPMLPDRLSGDLCSLRANEDRFAVSLFLRFDRAGRVLAHRYERTLIRSRFRLAYEDVQEVLDGKRSVDELLAEALRTLDDLARVIREERRERGALDLDLPEAKVLLDEDGVPVDIQRRPRLASHRLVEDFMILANETVAADAEERGLDLLYRVHEGPTRERTEELRVLLSRLGHRLGRRGALRPKDVQRLLDAVRGHPEETLVSTVVLRSLGRARYDPHNLGHFGLASDHYLHFTSPIRRYPDLVVHREVVRTLVDGAAPRRRDADELRSVAERANAREEAAKEAERASIAMKKVEFMERHLGEEFDGRISGVAAFGFFVTLDRFFVDGLVHVNSLQDDFYRLQEERYALVGDRGRRSYRLGQPVRVQVARVDKEARHVDFLLIRAGRAFD